MSITKEKFGKYEGKWVALGANEKVIDSASSFEKLAKKMDKMKTKKKYTLMHIPSFKLYWAPSAWHAQKIQAI